MVVFFFFQALSSAILPLSFLSPFAPNIADRRHGVAQRNLANARKEAKHLAEIRRVGLMRRRKSQDPQHGDEQRIGIETRKGEPDGELVSRRFWLIDNGIGLGGGFN